VKTVGIMKMPMLLYKCY